jgi:hypothetical protein
VNKTVELIVGRYKRAGREGSEMKFASHYQFPITDNQGIKRPVAFGVNLTTGQVGTIRLDAFLGETTVTPTEEAPVNPEGWFLLAPGAWSTSWGQCEHPAVEDLPFLPEGAKPLADFLTKK